ncbi:AbrB family transcriptional regulator [Heyndrickxia acidicola]|uniref:AbrB family transcriptional regulator n=1 Tax=Heyndrickxia acidicola TaxID=209389 RepID=A0ABU6MHC4_9BACI|nr:AbrB family transcriptional regulator [Heyndrickxia acidicola]MED1203797.1 AbrB family transcriptional regulator [Heyndrickxia acidicola]
MKNFKQYRLLQNGLFIMASSTGGYLLSLTGMSIAWMVGTLIMAGILSFWQPQWFQMKENNKGVHPYWRYIGQAIIGIELGQKMNMSVIAIFENNAVIITVMLLFSIILSLLCGIVLWRFSKADILTSLFSTTPGGISAMPSIAEEVGANTVTVSLVQMLRIFLVVGTVPILASSSLSADNSVNFSAAGVSPITSILEWGSASWTAVLILGSGAGYLLGKKIKLPAPWLVGGMIGVSSVQMLGSFIHGNTFLAWWPHWFIVLAQVFIGSSIGSKLNKKMFIGSKNIILLGSMTSAGMISAMAVCAWGVSEFTQIPFVTALLAFAPGGVAEMATASAALHAGSDFVVAVQVMRLISIFILLPPFFRLLNRQVVTKAPSQKIF